jgi:ABC-2 type transport system ATP-binding protein
MGKTIIISSHILLELAEMCSDIAIISGGRLIVSGDVEQVSRRLGDGRQLEIRVLERIPETVQLLKDMPGISNVVNENGNLLQAEFTGDDRALHDVLAQLITHKIPVISFAPRGSGGRLEEVFMNITEGASPS